MAIPTDAILRAVAKFIMPAEVEMQAVFNLKFLNNGTSDDEADVLLDLSEYAEKLWDTLTAQMSEDVDPTEVESYIWDSVGLDWDRIGSEVFTKVFLNASDMLPHGVAGIVIGRTTDPDVNGRKYIGGMTEPSVVNSSWISSTLLAYLDFAAAYVGSFLGTATGSSYTPGVWSGKDLVFVPFRDSYIVNGIAGYQRRRKPGVGI